MDIKSKNNKEITAGKARFGGQWPAILVCLLVCAALSLGLLTYGAWSFKGSDRSYSKAYQEAGFVSELYQDSYMLYWKLQQEELDDFALTPAEVFFPGYPEGVADATISEDAYASEEEFQEALDEYQTFIDSYNQPFSENLLELMNNRSHLFNSTWAGTGYLAVNLENDHYLGTWNDDLAALLQGKADSATQARLQEEYAYYAVLRFGENGNLGVPVVYGASSETMEELRDTDMQEVLMNAAFGHTNEEFPQILQPPKNMAVVFPIPKTMVSSFYSDTISHDIDHMSRVGIPSLYFLAVLAAMATAAVLCLRPGSSLKNNLAAKLPPEISLIAIAAALGFYSETLDYSLMHQFRGDYMAALANRGFSSGSINFALTYGFFAAVLGGIFLASMAGAASVTQIKELGFLGYLQEKSLALWFWRKFSAPIKMGWRWITDIDLSDKSNRAILKILIANFVVLALLCSIWFYGIFGLIIYSIILYLVLQNYANKLKLSYAKLLDATGQMAEGRLDVTIDKNLGLFAPLGEELEKVQQGFTLAVQEQTKSQRMKTELISNVSHDLKTPLTAIITYVNLLKQDDLTDEERQSYVATLDQKSQRLKHLIEDLFEMSKASSGNIVLHPTKVDLPALVRQVELEAQDALEQAGIEFRYNFPPGKVELLLDGEKTSRIFENLIMNVAKYGMPGTRAYVTIVAGEKLVTLEMKNISKNELTFDAGEITERFMRGDASRSTNGSGLGLAIAKSFVDAQGGQFKIVTDGDMFKAYITFSRLPGIAVPRAAAPQPDTSLPGADFAAGFTAPSSAYKPPAAAFDTGGAYTENQPPYSGPYGHPYQPQPPYPGANGHLGQMTFNQVADSAVNMANQAVNAVATAARQVADKAKQAGLTAKEEQQAAKKSMQEAKQQAKETARRLRKEAREARRNWGKGSYPAASNPQAWQNSPYMPQAPAPQPPFDAAHPYAPAYRPAPPMYPPPYAPAYTPPPNPEPAPAEVLHPEELFSAIPDPSDLAPIEAPVLTLEPQNPTGDSPLPTPGEDSAPAPHLYTESHSPKLELYPMPELILSDQDPWAQTPPEQEPPSSPS